MPFDTAYAHKSDAFAAKPGWVTEANQCLRAVLPRSTPCPLTYLDFACNTGRIFGLVPAVHTRIGVDVNEYALKLAREKRQHVDFRSSLTGVKDESVDAVTFMHALCQVDDATAVLNELFRVMKPGARMAVLVHNVWHHRMMALPNLFNGYKSDPNIKRHFSLSTLRSFMRDHGFDVVEASKMGDEIVPSRLFMVVMKPV